MKKYKLIKEYPGSEELGTIGWIENKTLAFQSTDGQQYWDSNNIDFDKYPEYWESIAEKEWEILSFYTIGRITNIGTRRINGKFSFSDKDVEGMGEESLYLSFPQIYGIHSVKRLSDGEVFTIGDKLDSHINKDITREIYEIRLLRDTVISLYVKGGWEFLKDAIKAKKPLFTTEDGIDIYEGDTVWRVADSDGNIFKNPSEVGTKGWKDFYEKNYNVKGQHPNHIHFLSKKAAEEYIIMNKPCLSANDIIAKGYIPKNVIIELVKSKLK